MGVVSVLFVNQNVSIIWSDFATSSYFRLRLSLSPSLSLSLSLSVFSCDALFVCIVCSGVDRNHFQLSPEQEEEERRLQDVVSSWD
jgi:hypothetical protein